MFRQISPAKACNQEIAPRAAPTRSAPAEVSSACSVPKCTVSQPQHQLPPAMPPKVAIWYSANARPTTQRGADNCTVALKVDNASTQQAPAKKSASIISHIHVL